MKKFLKFYFLVFLLLGLAQCAGTGSKTKPVITSSNSGKTNLYFLRDSGFIASGVLARVTVNGTEIAKLGIKESVVHSVGSNYKIKISGAGIGGIGMGSDSASGIADGNNNFYLISIKQGLFSTKWIITETTEAGFKAQ